MSSSVAARSTAWFVAMLRMMHVRIAGRAHERQIADRLVIALSPEPAFVSQVASRRTAAITVWYPASLERQATETDATGLHEKTLFDEEAQ